MTRSAIIDPRSQDSANAPIEIWRDVGRGPGIYMTSEAYPEPPQDGAKAAGDEGERRAGAPRRGNRQVPLGVYAMEDPSIPAGTNLVPFTADNNSIIGFSFAPEGSLAISSVDSYKGERSFLLTKATAAGPSMSFTPTAAGGKASTARALRRYIATVRAARLDPATPLRNLRVNLVFYDVSNAQVGSTTVGTNVREIAGEWPVATVSAIAPDLAVKVVAVPVIERVSGTDDIPVGEGHLIDAIQIEERLPTLREILGALGSRLLLGAFPNPATSVVDEISANAYPATLQNGAAVTAYALAASAPGALALDGSNDYASFAVPTRRNRVTNPQPSGTTGWTSYQGTFTAPAGSSPYGASVFRHVCTAAGPSQAGLYLSSKPLAVAAGTTYAASALPVMFPAGRTARVEIEWYTSGGALISRSVVTRTASPDGTRTGLTAVAPPTAAKADVFLSLVDAVSGDVQEWAGVLFEESSTVGAYFDGSGYVNGSGTWVPATDVLRTDLGDTAWTGTAHASTSTRAGRTNLCTNPRASVNTTGWTNGGVTLTRNATPAGAGAGLPVGVTETFNFTGAANAAFASCSVPVVSGTTYTFTMFVRLNSLSASDVSLNWRNAANSAKASSTFYRVVGGNYARLSVTVTADATETWTARIRQEGAGAVDLDFSAVLIEASAAVNGYFDGSGSVEHRGLTGWLGLEHASASDYGVFANGTTRAYWGVAQVSADAADGTGQTLWASNIDTVTTGTSLRLTNSGGTRFMVLRVGGTAYAWTLTAGEIAATAAGQTFAYRLEFNETTDTATLQINGLPAVTKTGVTAQHGAGQTTVQLGAYASGSDPFPGKKGPTSILSGIVSAEAWTTFLAAVAAASNGSNPTPYFDGDFPGHRWSGTPLASTSIRPAPGGARLDAIVGDLEEKLAKIADNGGTYRRDFTAGPGFFDLEGAAFTSSEHKGKQYRQGGHSYELSLEAAPYVRGEQVDYPTASETTLPALRFEGANVPGTVRGQGRLTITDLQGRAKRGIVAGIEARSAPVGATDAYYYVASNLTPGPNASVAGDTSSVGGSHVRLAGNKRGWQEVVNTLIAASGLDMTHRAGVYAVWARVTGSTGSPKRLPCDLRFEVATGADFSRRVLLDPVSIGVRGRNNHLLVKLGVIRLPEGSKWRGRVLARAPHTTINEFPYIAVEDLRFVPANDAYIEIGAPLPDDEGAIVAQSDFDEYASTGNLAGTATKLASGQMWDPAAANGTDLIYDGTNDVVYRAVNGSASNSPRMDAAGSAPLSDCVVQVATRYVGPGGSEAEHGIFARFASTSDYLALTLRGADVPWAAIALQDSTMLSAGTLAEYQGEGPTAEASPYYTDEWVYLRLMTLRDGVYVAWAGLSLSDMNIVAAGRLSSLATGGSKASGLFGLIDYNTGGIGTTRREWKGFRVWGLTPDMAIEASRRVRWFHSGVERETVAADIWTPGHRPGDNLLIPPARREARRFSGIVFATAGDLDDVIEDPTIDDISAQLSITPRYLNVRR